MVAVAPRFSLLAEVTVTVAGPNRLQCHSLLKGSLVTRRLLMLAVAGCYCWLLLLVAVAASWLLFTACCPLLVLCSYPSRCHVHNNVTGRKYTILLYVLFQLQLTL
jgi:hypothetical protein